MIGRGGHHSKHALEVNSSMGSNPRKPHSNSQIGDDEFALSNSEFLTDEDGFSRMNIANNRTPTHISNQIINQ